MDDIYSKPQLHAMYLDWSKPRQKEFLDFCSSAKGLKVLYDGFFKEVFSPEYVPQRLEEFLFLILKRKVIIKTALTNNSTRPGPESTLLSTDIIVQLEDGSLADIEIQKIGYAFPGQRCACYSSDHLLRQYKRVRERFGKSFTYRKIKQVYTIILLEESTSEFHGFPDRWLHHFRQQSDTGMELELLQEYYFIPLDIFRKNTENKDIHDGLEAWLTFLTSDNPVRIEELITRFPRFKTMYEDIYELCLNTERVMEMYSKELQKLDENTVLYMIDELKAERDEARKEAQVVKEQARIAEEQVQAVKEQARVAEEQMQAAKEQARVAEEKEKATEQRALAAEEQTRKLQEQLRALGVEPI